VFASRIVVSDNGFESCSRSSSGSARSVARFRVAPCQMILLLLLRSFHVSKARLGAAGAYAYRRCIVCGLQLQTCLMIAHLDRNGGNNDPNNLADLCGTHHWMYDAGLYPIEAITLLRAHWQKTKGIPNHAPRMKTAGANAAKTRKRKAAARKAVETRRRNQRPVENRLDKTAT
jgi:hypothetical protein